MRRRRRRVFRDDDDQEEAPHSTCLPHPSLHELPPRSLISVDVAVDPNLGRAVADAQRPDFVAISRGPDLIQLRRELAV